MSEVVVPQEVLEMLLIGQTRYALGRATYTVRDTAEVLKKYWRFVGEGPRAVILNSVEEAVERAERRDDFVGMPMDHRTWKAFLLWAEAQPPFSRPADPVGPVEYHAGPSEAYNTGKKYHG